MARRKYRNDLDFIAGAFRACWETALELVDASRILRDNGHHAQALSLAVLALEELGKLFCVDGLLFARPDDEKARAFANSLKSHATKLSALELLPSLLSNLSSVDARNGEPRFAQAIVASARDLGDRGSVVLGMLDDGSFHTLNNLKQAGFYSEQSGSSFVKPSDSIRPESAEAVYMLAWRACSTVDFLLKDGNLERYIDTARTLRSKLTEEVHQEVAARANEILTAIFPDDAAPPMSDEPTLH